MARLAGTALCLSLLHGCSMAPQQSDRLAETTAPARFEEASGIQVEALRLSAGGYMIDLRYRMLDQDKAAGLLKRSTQAYLIDQASGAKLTVPDTPKLGRLRQTARGDKPDHVYFMLFANPGKFLQPGSHLTLVAGDLRLENLVLQ